MDCMVCVHKTATAQKVLRGRTNFTVSTKSSQREPAEERTPIEHAPKRALGATVRRRMLVSSTGPPRYQKLFAPGADAAIRTEDGHEDDVDALKRGDGVDVACQGSACEQCHACSDTVTSHTRAHCTCSSCSTVDQLPGQGLSSCTSNCGAVVTKARRRSTAFLASNSAGEQSHCSLEVRKSAAQCGACVSAAQRSRTAGTRPQTAVPSLTSDAGDRRGPAEPHLTVAHGGDGDDGPVNRSHCQCASGTPAPPSAFGGRPPVASGFPRPGRDGTDRSVGSRACQPHF